PRSLGVHKIRRQQQNAIRTRSFSRLCKLLRHRRAVAAPGQHRHTPRRLADRSAHHCGELPEREREELSRTACCKQPCRVVFQQPRDVFAIRRLVKHEVAGKVRHGKRQQTVADLLCQLCWAYLRHSFTLLLKVDSTKYSARRGSTTPRKLQRTAGALELHRRHRLSDVPGRVFGTVDQQPRDVGRQTLTAYRARLVETLRRDLADTLLRADDTGVELCKDFSRCAWVHHGLQSAELVVVE